MRVAMSMISRIDLTAWLGVCENALIASLVQLIYDAEVFELTRACLRYFSVDSETLALDVIDQVGPGGHFLDREHNAWYFRKALWLRDLTEFAVLPEAEERLAQKADAKLKEMLSSCTSST